MSQYDTLREYMMEAQRPLDANAAAFLDLYDRGAVRNLRAGFERARLGPRAGPSFKIEYQAGHRRFLELEWSMKIEAELMRRGIKMATSAEEAARGGALLSFDLIPIEIEYGREYTSSVLVELARERFGGVPLFAKALSTLELVAPSHDGPYAACRQLVAHTIDGYGSSLMVELKYSGEEAFAVLVGAVWYVLDERLGLSLLRSIA